MDPLAPDVPPAADPAPPEPRPAARPAWTWEDRAGVAFGVVAMLASFLPWRADDPWLVLRLEGAVTGLVGALAAVAYILGARGRGRPSLPPLSAVAGLLLATVAARAAWAAYGHHELVEPKLGVVGHLQFVGIGAYLLLAAGLLLVWNALPMRTQAPALRTAATPRERQLRWYVRYGLPLLVFLGAFSLYAVDLEKPSIIDFDEAHYVRVAQNMTDGVLIDRAWAEPRPHNFEHPPVGKYLIALGYFLGGEPHDELNWPQLHDLCDTDNPACAKDARSWRLMSAVVGALGVLGMYWLGLRLFNSAAVGMTAAGFLLFDNMYYLHARIAMLDIYPIAFCLLALGVYVGPRPWHKWVGSVFFGLAVASKHPALFIAPAFLLLAYLRSRRHHRWMRLRDALLHVLIVPGLVYVATYAPHFWVWARMEGARYALEMFVYVHQESFRWTYRAEVDKPHPYFSRPWTWLPMRRPVLYFVGYDAQGNVGHIYALGNAFVWWLGSLALLYSWFLYVPQFFLARPRLGLRAFWEWLARPFEFTDATARLWATLLFACSYGAFFLLKRDTFNFYFLQAAPYLSLILALYAGALWKQGPLGRLANLFLLAGAGYMFVLFHPVSAGTYITEEDFQHIMHVIPGMTQ